MRYGNLLAWLATVTPEEPVDAPAPVTPAIPDPEVYVELDPELREKVFFELMIPGEPLSEEEVQKIALSRPRQLEGFKISQAGKLFYGPRRYNNIERELTHRQRRVKQGE